jgi:hypothetical protein
MRADRKPFSVKAVTETSLLPGTVFVKSCETVTGGKILRRRSDMEG